MTVFVDVDDTLVLYKNEANKIHPYGVINGDEFEPNHELIERLREYSGHIIVWSGGGREYARQVARIVLLPENIRCMVASKFDDFGRIRAGDIVIDDQKEYFVGMEQHGVHVFGPFEEWTTVKENQ